MFFDLDNDFVDRCNHELIELESYSSEAMEEHKEFLSRMLDEQYVAETGSAGVKILNEFDFEYVVNSGW
jgi:glutamate synthase (NADPH/NADH) large chain